MLVLLVFLCALGISYTAASRIGAAAQRGIGSSIAQSSFASLSERISEACSLGDGNVRIVELSGGPASLSADGNSYSFSEGSFLASSNSSCEISVLQGQPSGNFTIRNNGGKIEIS